MRSSRRSGYTLVELMVVVAIIGVLISLALPAFRNYVMRVRAGEAPTFMGEIRLREEAYRAEFSQYCPTNGGSWNPAAIPPGGEPGPFNTTPAAWRMLGALPDGPVRFQYQVFAGAPGTPAVAGIAGLPGNDFTFVMQARADLDADGTLMAVEGYSESDRLYLSYGVGGAPLGPLWE